jgi:hypothetical protein
LVAVSRSVSNYLLELFIGQLRVRIGCMRARLLKQLLVIIGLQMTIAHGAVKLS